MKEKEFTSVVVVFYLRLVSPYERAEISCWTWNLSVLDLYLYVYVMLLYTKTTSMRLFILLFSWGNISTNLEIATLVCSF